jgi:hypothetical protein
MARFHAQVWSPERNAPGASCRLAPDEVPLGLGLDPLRPTFVPLGARGARSESFITRFVHQMWLIPAD